MESRLFLPARKRDPAVLFDLAFCLSKAGDWQACSLSLSLSLSVELMNYLEAEAAYFPR